MYMQHHVAARRLLQETASLSYSSAASIIRIALASAPNSTSSSPSSSSDQSQSDPNSFDTNSQFSPSMAIILVVLLSSFFFMGFFSIYVRRCTSDDEFDTNASANAAAARRPDSQQPQGVDAAILQNLPLVAYSSSKKKGSNVECVVCLTDFEENEPLRQLPKCKHVFHQDCIDMWLFSHTTCPLCRRSLISDGSRSFRWGGSSSIRLALLGGGSGRRSAAEPSTPTGIGTSSHRSPAGVTIVDVGSATVDGNLNGSDYSAHCRDQRLLVLKRSHSTGHSLLKRAQIRANFRHPAGTPVSSAVDGNTEEPQSGARCFSLTPSPFQRSRSVAALQSEEAEAPPESSNSSWMRGPGSWNSSLKRALSLNKLKLSPLQREAFSTPVGQAAASTSGRSTFERLTAV